MYLYLMRHGIAGLPPPGQGDAARALTPEGVDQLRRQSRAFARAGFRVDRLVSSPLVRARQTAEALADVLGAAPETDALLQPGCMLADVDELLARRSEAGRVLLVGHQPDLGRLVHTLSGANARIHPGTLAVLDVRALRPGGALLLGLYDPEVMARLG